MRVLIVAIGGALTIAPAKRYWFQSQSVIGLI